MSRGLDGGDGELVGVIRTSEAGAWPAAYKFGGTLLWGRVAFSSAWRMRGAFMEGVDAFGQMLAERWWVFHDFFEIL
jgi:hypothetical protein